MRTKKCEHTANYICLMRLYAGMTQAALARKAEVSLRSIQMYEQQRKDINKAQAETLFRLANTLGCREKDLLESR